MAKSLLRWPLLRAFGLRSFSLLWNGQALSRLGDHLYQVALARWVLQIGRPGHPVPAPPAKP